MLRNARNNAMQKYPEKEPLIVRTGQYMSAMEEKEILGVAIKAPFGSGKTFGIALKSYHDSRLNLYPMESTRVVVLRARELVHKDEFFDKLVKELKNVMCGGLLVSALRFVSERYGKCTRNDDNSCYTTLTEEEVNNIAILLREESLSRRLEKGINVEILAELLRRIKRDTLRGGNLTIVIDEVEGFLTELHLRASDVVYSNLAMMSKIYDQGIWGIKLVVLLQNKVIDDDWVSMIKRIKEGEPFISEELRSMMKIPSGTSIYVCPTTRERLDISALMGRIRLLSMAYYRGNIYTEYARLAFDIISKLNNKLSTDIVQTAEAYARQLSDLYVSSEVSRRLTFLESIAPRISFDYVDKLIENMLYTGVDKVEQALDKALHNVAEEWSKYDDIRKFYSKIIIKRIPRKNTTYGNISVFKFVNTREYSKIVESLAKDLYAHIISSIVGIDCQFDPRSARYHSNHIAAVSCLMKNTLFTGILILRTTTSKPSTTQDDGRFVEQLAKRIDALMELTVRPIVQSSYEDIKYHNIVGLMLVPEETSSTSYLELEKLLTNIMAKIKPTPSGKLTRVLSIPVLHQIREEDFIIIAEKTIEKEHSISVIDQFVDERYKDILAGLAGKVRVNIQL